MAALDLFNLAQNDDFQKKVRMYVLKSASSVVGEAATGLGIAQQAKRHALGVAALIGGKVGDVTLSPEQVFMRFSWAAAAFGTLTNESSDSDIEFVVVSLWDDLAGVALGDKAA